MLKRRNPTSHSIATLGLVLLISSSLAIISCRKNDFLYVGRNTDFKVTQTHRLTPCDCGKMDLLWVIDNSGSMLSYIPDLVENSTDFMKSFEGRTRFDWKMGVISTDIDNPPALGIGGEFSARTPMPVPNFQAAVESLGLGGVHQERVYEPIIKTLTDNPGFLRPDASLALMIVTDAPEQSSVSTSDFLTALRRITGITKRIAAFGAFAPTDFGCESTDDSWTLAGSKYGELITATNGSTISLCGGEFGKDMARIGRMVSSTDVTKVKLKSRPAPSSIHVSYRGKLIQGGLTDGYWTYDYEINSIVIHNTSFVLDADLDITIQYLEETGRIS